MWLSNQWREDGAVEKNAICMKKNKTRSFLHFTWKLVSNLLKHKYEKQNFKSSGRQYALCLCLKNCLNQAQKSHKIKENSKNLVVLKSLSDKRSIKVKI